MHVDRSETVDATMRFPVHTRHCRIEDLLRMILTRVALGVLARSHTCGTAQAYALPSTESGVVERDTTMIWASTNTGNRWTALNIVAPGMVGNTFRQLLPHPSRPDWFIATDQAQRLHLCQDVYRNMQRGGVCGFSLTRCVLNPAVTMRIDSCTLFFDSSRWYETAYTRLLVH